jgi:hypothetical protein
MRLMTTMNVCRFIPRPGSATESGAPQSPQSLMESNRARDTGHWRRSSESALLWRKAVATERLHLNAEGAAFSAAPSERFGFT